jgi:hypothetical protein
LQEVNLSEANLQGARFVTRDQLRVARVLWGATLPDGTTFPNDDTWREALEAWCEPGALDEEGFIVPAALDDANGDGWRLHLQLNGGTRVLRPGIREFLVEWG